MPPQVVGVLLTILAGVTGWLILQLWRRLRFVVPVAPGVVSAHQPEALEIPLRGRGRELEQLKARLGESNVMVIAGWGGVGKTALGRALAEQLETGQTGIWVDCKRGMRLEALINALANFFGVEYVGFLSMLEDNLVRSPQQAAHRFATCLDQRENVLFLDDFHVVSDRHVTYDLVRALRLETKHARTVILTREVDKLKEVLASDHATLTYSDELILGDLDRRGSLHLLRDRGLLDWPEEVLDRLYKKTRGHPKGLELCAGLLVGGMAIDEIEALPLFRIDEDEEKSLRGVLQETEKRLSRLQPYLLRRCSVFDEPFSGSAMAAVCPIDLCSEVTHRVEERFLLSCTNGRYDVHPLVREYFNEGLQHEAAFVHGLAGHYYLGEAKDASEETERLRLNLKAHWHFELANDRAQLVALFPRVFQRLEVTSRWAEARRIGELALDASRFLDDRRMQAQCLGGLGIICDDQGDPKGAAAYHRQALVIAREEGDRRGESAHLGDLGNAHAHMGQVEEAIRCYQQSLRMAIDAGDRKMEGWNLGNLGLVYSDLQELEKAIGYYEEALLIARETGDRRAQVNHLNNLGIANAHLGRPQKALDCYGQCLGLARALGDRRGEANALGNLGVTRAVLGDQVAAMIYYQSALEVARQIGHGRAESNQLNNLGEAWRARDKHEYALACYLLAVQVGRAVSDQRVDSTQQNILLLNQQLGDKEFAALLPRVDGRKEDIVARSLRTIARLGRTVCPENASAGGGPFPGN
jgi:tetratricopeptide (TPR) repeat protein